MLSVNVKNNNFFNDIVSKQAKVLSPLQVFSHLGLYWVVGGGVGVERALYLVLLYG